MIERRTTRRVMVGDVAVGGDAPVSVQSMTKTHTADIDATVAQIKDLEALDCHIIRCAVPDMAAADALAEIKRQIAVPLVADIHFAHRLAIRAIERGADCIRVNPGNIRDAAELDEIIAAVRAAGISVRIGVNAGSIRLPKSSVTSEVFEASEDFGGSGEPPKSGEADLVTLMVTAARRHCDYFEARGVSAIKVSLKASDVMTTIAANRAFAAHTDYPLHLGVTEAGPVNRALVKSAVGIGGLLAEGIGDTIRVSMTGPPADEVRAGHEILRAVRLESGGLNLISCPTCGRCRIDLQRAVAEVERALDGRDVPLTIAVMGCEVNGPGEAAEADIGVAGGRGVALLFRRGEPIRKVAEADLVTELLAEIERMLGDG